MDKIKEKTKINDNGEKKELTKNEKIEQALARISEVVKEYHRLQGYLAGLKESD